MPRVQRGRNYLNPEGKIHRFYKCKPIYNLNLIIKDDLNGRGSESIRLDSNQFKIWNSVSLDII